MVQSWQTEQNTFTSDVINLKVIWIVFVESLILTNEWKLLVNTLGVYRLCTSLVILTNALVV